LFLTDDYVYAGGSRGLVAYKYYETDNNGEAVGIIAGEFLKSKVLLPVVDGDFNIREQ
jgi:hypothetical protein